MRISELFRNYRKENNLTQGMLAEQLQISVMTISRIESGLSFRLTDALYDNMLQVFGKERLESLDRTITAAPIHQKMGYNLDSKQIILGYEDDLIDAFKRTGFTFSRNQKNIVYHKSFDLISTLGSKIWAVDFIIGKSVNTERFINHFSKELGAAISTKGISKYSLVIFGDFDTSLVNTIDISDKINIDVSIIKYNAEKQRFCYEIDLAFQSNGNGLFDLNVPGRELSSMQDYCRWKSSLTV